MSLTLFNSDSQVSSSPILILHFRLTDFSYSNHCFLVDSKGLNTSDRPSVGVGCSGVCLCVCACVYWVVSQSLLVIAELVWDLKYFAVQIKSSSSFLYFLSCSQMIFMVWQCIRGCNWSAIIFNHLSNICVISTSVLFHSISFFTLLIQEHVMKTS